MLKAARGRGGGREGGDGIRRLKVREVPRAVACLMKEVVFVPRTHSLFASLPQATR